MSFTSVPPTPISHPRRLLLPTVRNPRPPHYNAPSSLPSPTSPYRSPKIKASTSRSSRTRLVSPQFPPDLHSTMTVGQFWLGMDANFQVVQEQLQLDGFQLFAVEKWVTERTRPIITLAVYTGDPLHKITVTVLTPSYTLRPDDAKAEWDRVIRDLRQGGARPRDTEHGTLMVTSLANFRSDYTIVPIPSGYFLEARDFLYTNINLLRMGCSGRMALTLQAPRDTTKDRFIAMYRMNDKIRSFDRFNATILELVKLIQAALSLFGMFSLCRDEWNGLLCDLTVDGIQRWVTEIGEPLLGVEPTERVADPVVVCSLLSQVSNVRVKLYALGFGHIIPEDPFLDPQRFLMAVCAFQGPRATSSSSPSPMAQPFLTDDVLRAIETAYSKSRTTEPYKVHRVLLNKLDDLTTDLRTSSGPININPTNIDQFIHFAETKAVKDGVPCLKYLWSGRADILATKRKDRHWSDGEEDNGRDREGREKSDELSAGDEHDPSKPWPGKRVQRKIESWAGLSRQMRRNIDTSTRSHRGGLVSDSLSWNQDSPPIPRVIVSRDGEDEEIPSSGQVSPTLQSQRHYLGFAPSVADTSTSNLSDYERRLSEFNKILPGRPSAAFRVTSWSDSRSARGIAYPEVRDERSGGSIQPKYDETAKDSPYRYADKGTRPYTNATITRRRSFDDANKLMRSRVLPVQHMKVDVELCGQLLVMRRREEHLKGVVACLRILTSRLAQMNAYLREDYEAHQPELAQAEARTKIIADIEAARDKAYTMTQETQALSYEAAQFDVQNLWHAVSQQRQKVFEMRSRVFDTGQRAPGSGRFDRVLWTLDGQETFVDWAGRTDEEAVEERGLYDMRLLEEDEEGREDREREMVPKHPPSWLLKMFASWGNRWGAGWKKAEDAGTKMPPIVDGDKGMLSPSSEGGATSPVSVPTSPTPGLQ